MWDSVERLNFHSMMINYFIEQTVSEIKMKFSESDWIYFVAKFQTTEFILLPNFE